MDIKYKRYKVRLYPNKEQYQLMAKNCGCRRFIYNYFLAKAIEYYELTNESVNWNDLSKHLTHLKDEYTWLKEVNAQSLQQALNDLKVAYSRFFKNQARFPKFKKKGVSDSFRVPQHTVQEENYIQMPKYGWVKFRGNQDNLEGKRIKSITVMLEAGNFYGSVLVEVTEDYTIKHKHTACGIDIGVNTPLVIAYEQDGEVYAKQLGKKEKEVLKKKEKRRKRYQKSMARKQKGSNNRNKAKRKVQTAFYREAQYRENWAKQTANILTRTFKHIIVEDLKLRNMTKSAKGTEDNPGTNVKAKSGLNRELLRMGFGFLISFMEQKANERGGTLIKIDPKHTSQTCNNCGHTCKENRKSQAVFKCVSCGHQDHADANAATNILDKGLLEVAA